MASVCRETNTTAASPQHGLEVYEAIVVGLGIHGASCLMTLAEQDGAQGRVLGLEQFSQVGRTYFHSTERFEAALVH
jgi:glycine/D-amino acid oxidase-like deaminating enzyme